MKNRIELAQHFRDLGFQTGVEVGVCDGRYSAILMQTIPGLKLTGIDPYTAYEKDSKGRSQNELDGKLKQAQTRLGAYVDYELVICHSVEAAKLIPDESLDFVFIDANHAYEFVKADIQAWYPKVRYGGIVSGHDYYEFKSGKGGVVQAVDEFVESLIQSRHESGEIIEDNILQTTEWDEDAHPDDKQPDWYFVK